MARDLPDRMPVSISKLPVNKAGYPVPWFVARIEGDWDFRVVRPAGIDLAMKHHLCWICGEQRDAGLDAFVVGPMCAVNRTSVEPPSHLSCARWAAIACPFLANPKMVRREKGIPEDSVVYGTMIERNPGVTLVWAARPEDWSIFSLSEMGLDGFLFDISMARRTEWYAHGRTATREEVLESIDTGLPILHAAAKKDGPEALVDLKRRVEQALMLVPNGS